MYLVVMLASDQRGLLTIPSLKVNDKVSHLDPLRNKVLNVLLSMDLDWMVESSTFCPCSFLKHDTFFQ